MGTLELLGHDSVGCVIVRPALCRKRLEGRVFLIDSSVYEIKMKGCGTYLYYFIPLIPRIHVDAHSFCISPLHTYT
jgi:hypothetical protein